MITDKKIEEKRIGLPILFTYNGKQYQIEQLDINTDKRIYKKYIKNELKKIYSNEIDITLFDEISISKITNQIYSAIVDEYDEQIEVVEELYDDMSFLDKIKNEIKNFKLKINDASSENSMVEKESVSNIKEKLKKMDEIMNERRQEDSYILTDADECYSDTESNDSISEMIVNKIGGLFKKKDNKLNLKNFKVETETSLNQSAKEMLSKIKNVDSTNTLDEDDVIKFVSNDYESPVKKYKYVENNDDLEDLSKVRNIYEINLHDDTQVQEFKPIINEEKLIDDDAIEFITDDYESTEKEYVYTEDNNDLEDLSLLPKKEKKNDTEVKSNNKLKTFFTNIFDKGKQKIKSISNTIKNKFNNEGEDLLIDYNEREQLKNQKIVEEVNNDAIEFITDDYEPAKKEYRNTEDNNDLEDLSLLPKKEKKNDTEVKSNNKLKTFFTNIFDKGKQKIKSISNAIKNKFNDESEDLLIDYNEREQLKNQKIVEEVNNDAIEFITDDYESTEKEYVYTEDNNDLEDLSKVRNIYSINIHDDTPVPEFKPAISEEKVINNNDNKVKEFDCFEEIREIRESVKRIELYDIQIISLLESIKEKVDSNENIYDKPKVRRLAI